MSDSLDLGPESGVNSRLAVLRQLTREPAPQPAQEPLVPGLFFDTDPEAPTTVTVTSRPGELLKAEFDIAGKARWLGMHINLTDCPLDGKMLLGVAIRSKAPLSQTFRLCLRNGREGGFDDIFFRKTAIAYTEPSLHLDALSLADHPGLAAPAPWRELILFFRPENGAIDLQDLRVFAL